MYNRRTTCTKNKCQKAARARVQARRREAGAVPDERDVHGEKQVFCYEVLDLLGVRQCDPMKMDDVQRRNGLGEDDISFSYLVFGNFVVNENDNGFHDTRWIDLEELLGAVDDDVIAKFHTSMTRTSRTARKCLRKRLRVAEERLEEEDMA